MFKMKFLIAIFLIATNSFCVEQNTKEQMFQLAVRDVARGFSKHDSLLLSKYIYREIGVHLLYRNGVFNTYTSFRKINFSDASYPVVLFQFSKGITPLPLRYQQLPVYNCAKESWNKKGSFVDTTTIDHLLSKICSERNRYASDNISQKTINTFINLENKSRRVVLVDQNKKELVFYLSYINRRWYVTMFDSVSSDCSV